MSTPFLNSSLTWQMGVWYLLVVCDATTFFRRLAPNKVEFGGSLTIDSRLYGVRADRFAQYLTPQRVVAAAWDPKMIQALGDDTFRLRQDPYKFADVLQVAISVDVQVKRSGTGLTLASRDIDCVAGIGRDLQKLDLGIQLDGSLEPQRDTIARLKGSFKFTTSGTLVGPLILLPDAVLSTATSGVNLGILAYARNRFVKGIDADYRRWARLNPDVH